MPLSREEVLVAIAPQIDNLVAFGFHQSGANKAYMDAVDVATGNPSVLELRFRNQMQSVLYPTTVENRSNLLLVIPTLPVDWQSYHLGIQYWSKKEPYVYPEEDLPQVPYVIEVIRGSTIQSPKVFTRRAVGLVDSLLSPDKAGSLNAIRQGLQKKSERGLSIYELFAYVREHRDGIDTVHGLKRMLMELPEGRESGDTYYPSIVRNGILLQYIRSSLLYIPDTMAEILHTYADTQFVGGATT